MTADAKGQYTSPRAPVQQESLWQWGLSAVFFPSSGWEPEYGGFTSYIAKGEDEEVRASFEQVLLSSS